MMSPENSTGYPYPRTDSKTFDIRLTPEEHAFLKDCNREGFYKKGIPYTLLFGCGAFSALKMGFLKPHLKYGALPPIGIASVIGGFIGLFSYKRECIQKLLEMPNSNLKKQLDVYVKQQQPIVAKSSQFTPEMMELDTDTNMISGSQMESYQSTSDFDEFTGVDIDGYKTSKPIDAGPLGKIDTPVSYDDLRRRNREEYMRPVPSGLRQGPIDSQPIHSQTRTSEEPPRFDRDRVPQYQLVD